MITVLADKEVTMCTPRTDHEDPVRGAQMEISSAMSALNMHADPIPESKQLPDNPGYLSYTDAWAQHAMEHMDAAMKLLMKAMNQQSCSVRLLAEMETKGEIDSWKMFGSLMDIRDGNITPVDEMKRHLIYLKGMHALNNDE